MCYGGLCSLDVDDIWDLFESLAWYQWQYESVSESFVCPSLLPCGLHAQSPCLDQLGIQFITILRTLMLCALSIFLP